MTVILTGDDLTFDQLYSVVLRYESAELAPAAASRMQASRSVVDHLVASGATAYGINTGFGKLASVRISAEQVKQLQVNLVRSHACGVGEALSIVETRAMVLLRANALAKGLSGTRPIIVETLCKMLNAKVHPVIPSQGSVGASGDLAPLAHLAQVVIGEGQARLGADERGDALSGGEALKRAGISPTTLEAKEGLSLLNGTQGMLALLSLALREADVLADTTDVAASLSLDALRGSPGAFDARIMRARAYAGAGRTARNLAHLNEGSQIRESHRSAEKDPRVQDAYSLRCTPQVHGAVRDSLAQARDLAAVELNSATDNPLVLVREGKSGAPEGDIISGGNFHGQPLAMAADQVAIALATLGGISERRIEQMTNPLTSMLPAFLTPEPGLNSGFMIAQVTAAALASENKALAAPHSVDSISTSGNQEDYVSMGMSGARRLARMLANLRHIVAIELLCACQGIDLLAPLRTGTLGQKAYDAVRTASRQLTADRPLAPDIAAVSSLIADQRFSSLLAS